MDTINQVYQVHVAKSNARKYRASFLSRNGLAPVIHTFRFLIFVCLLAFSQSSPGEETNQPTTTPIIPPPDTNYLQILQTLAGLGDQLRSNQFAIEQNGKEAKEASAHNAELFSNGLQSIQQTFSSQQQALADRNIRELQAIESSNRVVVMAGGVFAAVVALTLFLVVYFQWRISKAWTHISHMPQVSHGLGAGETRALGPGSSQADSAGLSDATNTRLLHAVEQLETRLQGLEHNAGSTASGHRSQVSAPGNGDSKGTRGHVPISSEPGPASSNAQARISAWLGQGQSMLKQNDWQAALQCFDEVLALEPNHGEALVRKGAALEHMKKLSEAFECYDRAIAADESMTIAYLHKGGLCSRLERFKEALECYEKALRTHTEWGS
jgi:tetratricopeptide (TPR) repeat protein